jgi:hypothetical protein
MKAQFNIKESFYLSFDPSRITTFLNSLSLKSEASRRNENSFLGEGTHFQSFQLSTSPIPLAVNVAKGVFMEKSATEVDQWIDSIKKLRSIEFQDLIPPLEVVRSDGLLAIVMPKGKPLQRKGAVAREASDALIQTSRALGHAGLVLDDYPQLVECGGVVFINDWSDLQRVC